MTPITLWHPVRVTGITFHALHVAGNVRHGDLGVEVTPTVVVFDLFQYRYLEIESGCRMQHDLFAILDDVTKRVAAGGQQVTVPGRIRRSECECRGRRLGQPPGFGAQVLLKLFAITERQLPWILVRRAVAVAAFDLHLRQGRAKNIAVTMHIDGCVAILA